MMTFSSLSVWCNCVFSKLKNRKGKYWASCYKHLRNLCWCQFQRLKTSFINMAHNKIITLCQNVSVSSFNIWIIPARKKKMENVVGTEHVPAYARSILVSTGKSVTWPLEHISELIALPRNLITLLIFFHWR